MTIEEDRIESQDYLFMQCLRDKKCKRHVNMKTGKNIFGEKHWRAKDEVVNAFDLDEIAFLTGLHKDLVSTSGAKLVRMDFTNTLEWQDEANNDHTFLWYLSDKGKQYLQENEVVLEKKIKDEIFEINSDNPDYAELNETKLNNLNKIKPLAKDVSNRILDLMWRSDVTTQVVWTQMFIRTLTKILKDSGYSEQQINNIVMDATLSEPPDV